jgi:hypothetical protein
MGYRETPPQLALPAGCPRVPGAWWKPNSAFIEELAAALQGQRVLEIFAGNGYLAAQLQARGVAVTATTVFAGHDGHERGVYHPVLELDACQAVRQHGAEHDVLLLCWPTTTLAAVRAAALWGGDRIIAYIGEVTDYSRGELGGCATDEFFERVTFHRKFDSYRGSAMEGAYVGRYSAPAAGVAA